jgi:hypothetical protein
MYCFWCGDKISNYEIYKRFEMARVLQCQRFMYLYKCKKCNKGYDYKNIKRHNFMFKIVLEQINNKNEIKPN